MFLEADCTFYRLSELEWKYSVCQGENGSRLSGMEEVCVSESEWDYSGKYSVCLGENGSSLSVPVRMGVDCLYL